MHKFINQTLNRIENYNLQPGHSIEHIFKSQILAYKSSNQSKYNEATNSTGVNT